MKTPKSNQIKKYLHIAHFETDATHSGADSDGGSKVKFM